MSKKEIRPIKINIPEHHDPVDAPKRSNRKRSIFFLAGILILGVIVWQVFTPKTSVFNYIFPSGDNLKKTAGRVNVLLLGNAGGKHDGAKLTDSIVVASYNIETKQSMLISIPRDLWLESIGRKVNAAYETGEENKNGSDGLKFAEKKISEIVGLPIHYGVRLDFNGFSKAIDQIGGIEVDVPRSFDDYMYPKEGAENDSCGLIEKEVELDASTAAILNTQPGKRKVWVRNDDKAATEAADFYCRFEHINFKKGTVSMDGTTALKFVRSRQGTNGEGSDFARSRRQQLVIEAFRQKILSLETLANPARIIGLIGVLGTSIETDIPADKYLEFYNLVKEIKESKSIVLGNLEGGDSILINPSPSQYGGAWVLIPPGNDFTPIKDYIKRQLDGQEASRSAKIK